MIEEACRHCPFLWRARSGQIALLKKTDYSTKEWIDLAVTLAHEFAEFPAAGDVLIQMCEPRMKGLTPEQRADVLAQVARAITRVPSHRQAGLDAVVFSAMLSRQIAVYGPKVKEVKLLVENAVFPHKNPKITIPTAIEGITQPGLLVRYLNALAPAANLRSNFAKAVEAAVAACPEEVRSQVQLNLAPPSEPPRPVYKAKEFVNIAQWDEKVIAEAPVVTQGWRELEWHLPPVMPRDGQLVFAAVHREGGPATVSNLRLYADGVEVDADPTTYRLQNRRAGTFVVHLNDEAALGRQLTIRLLVADDFPPGAAPVARLAMPKASQQNAQ